MVLSRQLLQKDRGYHPCHVNPEHSPRRQKEEEEDRCRQWHVWNIGDTRIAKAFLRIVRAPH